MNTYTAPTAILAIAILWSSAEAQDRQKLLPSEEAAKISMTWRLDGRAQLVTVKNDSRLVLISAELACELYDASKPIPKFAPNGDEVCVSNTQVTGKGMSDGLDQQLAQLAETSKQKLRLMNLRKECVSTYPISHTLPEPVLPGKSKEFYFETDKQRLPPIHCALTELRGRARKLWEF